MRGTIMAEEQTTPTAAPVAAAATAAAVAVNPGKTLGIVSFVLSLLGGSLLAIILGAVALSQSKKAGQKNGFALAAIVISIVETILIITIIAVSAAATATLTVVAN